MRIFEKYAEYYDLIYQDKDYEGECDFIEEIFQGFSPRPVRAILDGGCGTGGHAILLAKRGYEVTGIDGSETMISRAKEKLRGSNLRIDFQSMDLRDFDLGMKFDACICMFPVTLRKEIEGKAFLEVFGQYLSSGGKLSGIPGQKLLGFIPGTGTSPIMLPKPREGKVPSGR